MIYLDNHATTPVDPRVLDAMLPYLKERFGNAASRSHRLGWEAEEAVERARAQVARLVGADPREIVFTSGASEANNLALKGAAGRRGEKNHVVASPLEHPSVRETVEHLAARGCDVTWLPVDREGRVRPDDVAGAITPRTFLVTVMAANNEIGTVQPVREIGRIAAECGILFHTDATQAVGKVALDVRADGVHLAALTAHKIFGPKGSGALYVRQGTALEPQTHGGGQERGLRSGTLNVPGIVGLGAACDICRTGREGEAARLARLRDRLEGLLAAAEARANGPREGRLPNNLHISFPGVDAESLMLAVPEVAVSSGSACASGSMEISRVLKAIGMRPDAARGSIRFGLGRFNTEAEIDEAARLFVAAATRLRKVARR
ncbi:MAG TPA: cysteine desulfurase family protein [Planctomycetota bacterium]|nr:cysteine desulfurase family protein [Planctomycetota bacterium]